MQNKNWLIIKQYSKRNKTLKENGFNSYKEFLKSDNWKLIHALWEKKKKIGKDRWTMCYCCSSKDRLQLHHLKYSKVIKPVLGSNIVPVCRSCHELIHAMTQEHVKWSIKTATKKLAKKFHANTKYRRT